MMTQEEIMREVKRLQIVARHTVTEVFAGEYSSAFKGRGMEFAEVREYQPGDDVRTIDWNVTARAGKPYIKRFTEERELTIMLAVDLSASGRFGSGDRLKRELAAEISAVLAFAAVRKNDRIGLLAFTDEVELYVPPKKGTKHTLRIVRELLALEPKGKGTDLKGAVDHLLRVLPRRSIVFVVSDFLVNGVEETMRVLGSRHDATAIHVNDPREIELPRAGIVEFEDAETGKRVMVDTSSRQVRGEYAALMKRRMDGARDALRRSGMDVVRVSTAAEYIHELVMFFRARERRR
jgi:uncharacterized protein (DUF58 family)